MLVIILCLLFGHASCLPSVSCFQDGQSCVITDNLIESFITVTTWEECSMICRVDQQCRAFNFFGASSDESNSCLLLSACEDKVPCDDCVIGTEQKKCTCSIGYTSNHSDTLDRVESVSDEMSCKFFCLEKENCTHYTYYNSNDPNSPETCLLLPSPDNDEMARCEHCATGPSFCYTGE